MASSGIGVRAARKLDGSGGILFRRWAGCWIDFIVAGILFIASAAPFAAVSETDLTDGQAIAVFFTGVVAIAAYFTVSEGLTGRTLGKLLTGTIVVDAEGRPPGIWRALVRTLMRLVEVNPLLLGGIPAGIVVAMTKEKQRLGDLAAGTYVVPVKTLQGMSATPAIAGVFD
jgi:uncharacterized RDD family membrane protein YckC